MLENQTNFKNQDNFDEDESEGDDDKVDIEENVGES